MAAAAPLGEFLAKGFVVGTADETRPRQTTGYGGVKLLLVDLILGLQVDQGDSAHRRPRRISRVLEETSTSFPVSADS